MSEVRDQYLVAAYKLSKKGGPEWFEFVEAFKLYVSSELERGLSSPTDSILVSFGMSRSLLTLRDDLINIEKLADKLEARAREIKNREMRNRDVAR